MANQMIALGVRGPQLPNVGGRAQQYANIMANLATAREKQGQTQRAREFRDLAESGIDVTTPEGFSRLAGLDPEGAAAIRKSALEKRVADADYALKYLGTAQEELSRANTPQEAMAIGQMLKQAYPMFAGNVDEQLQTLPSDPAAFMTWRENTTLSAMKSAERMKYFRDEVKTEMVTSETGDPLVATYGGLGTPTLKTPRSLVLAPRTGQFNVEPSVPVDDGMGGPDTNAVADLAGGIVNAENDRDYQAALAILDRQAPDMAAQVRSAMPRFDPARIQSIRAALQEEMGVGAAPLVEGARGGVGGPDEGYVEAPRPFRLKNPMQSPLPGSAQVPISRVRAEAQAERKTPVETYEEKRAEQQAASDVKFLDSVGASKDQARNVLSVIDQMIGDLNVKDGKIVKGKRPPHPGFESVVGAGIPGLRFIPGTQSADFDAFMDQVEGGAFLDAYESLKGTGQITEKEGEKATSAITRMKRSSSEVGFVKAAREFADIVRRGLERAEAREARLRGKTPTARSSGGRRLRFNPATGELE